MATGRVPTTANSPLTAKGDLFGYSTTQARVAVGNNGETLVADSSTTTGLRYTQNYAAGKNKIINGDFGIWQRGTSFSNPATGTYTADRWRIEYNGSGATRTFSQQTFTPGTAPVAGYEGSYFFRYARTVAGTGATADNVVQRIEDVRIFAGQTATLSFWAKVDSGTPTLTLRARQNFGSGGSGLIDATDVSITLSTSWTRYIATFAIPSISGKTIGTNSQLEIQFRTAVNTIQTLDLWGVQLEAGSVATAFQTATGTLQGELAACQRYYYRANGSGSAAPWTTAYYYGSTSAAGVFTLPVTMRTTPTFTPSAATIATLYSNGSAGASTAITDNGGNNNTAFILFSRSGTANSAASVTIASGYLEWSSEL